MCLEPRSLNKPQMLAKPTLAATRRREKVWRSGPLSRARITFRDPVFVFNASDKCGIDSEVGIDIS